MNVLAVVGARPQFIKAAVVSRALRRLPGIREILVHTGQHYDENMSRAFFRELGIPEPDYHLGIGGGTHGQNTGRMMEATEAVLLKECPDWVLVYGDTDTTLAGTLAAVKLHIPVAHVEAGLRSFNRRMPEEINRVLTDHAADLLFAPTDTARENLRREGIPEERIQLVGDVMLDAALFYAEKAMQQSRILDKLGLKDNMYVLVTVHRAENTETAERLKALLEALADVHREVPVVFPVHPRTRKAAEQFGLGRFLQSIRAIDPVGYLDMVMLEKNALAIATDSGGVQKEAFFYRVPCITLREDTEWVELVELGWNRLCPPVRWAELASILRAAQKAPGKEAMPYGDGKASERIAHLFLSLLFP